MPDALCLSMEIPPDVGFVGPVVDAAKTLAERMGIGKRESFRFQLTVEEFCLCLIGLIKADEPLRIGLTGKRRSLRAVFTFNTTNLSLAGLNLTACPPVRMDGEQTRDLGLLLAAKAADRFHLDPLSNDGFRIVAEVDRLYPELPPVQAPENPRPPFRLVQRPDTTRISQAVAMAMTVYSAKRCPASFQTPAKFAELVDDSEASCVMVQDSSGQTVGLLNWAAGSDRAVYFSGPFVFTPETMRGEVSRLLLDGFLEAVARERFLIVLNFQANDDLLPGYFETLGFLRGNAAAGRERQTVVSRHLREDAGLAVWCAARIEPFLRQTYGRLALFRDILPVEDPVSRPRRESLLGATLDSCRGLAELRPFLDGEDMAENLAAHVQAIREKGIDNILFFMDLSRPWEAALAEDLTRAGFTAQIVLPHGGQADVVVWQHDEAP
ncbi:hypothetical protein JCM15519_20710 [Fundidesulfovibrio butyratiphilus]